MTPHELKQRTKRFAVVIVKFAMTLPRDPVTAVMTRQLVKSGTSLAANYRSSCRAKADFISKMGIAEDEADETCFWLEVLVEAEIVSQTAVVRYLDEADQLTRIFVTSINTARGSRRRN